MAAYDKTEAADKADEAFLMSMHDWIGAVACPEQTKQGMPLAARVYLPFDARCFVYFMFCMMVLWVALGYVSV